MLHNYPLEKIMGSYYRLGVIIHSFEGSKEPQTLILGPLEWGYVRSSGGFQWGCPLERGFLENCALERPLIRLSGCSKILDSRILHVLFFPFFSQPLLSNTMHNGASLLPFTTYNPQCISTNSLPKTNLNIQSK